MSASTNALECRPHTSDQLALSRSSELAVEYGPFNTLGSQPTFIYSPTCHTYGDLRPNSAAGKRIIRNADWDSPAWKGGPRKIYTSPGDPAWLPNNSRLQGRLSRGRLPRDVATFGDSRNLRLPPKFLYRAN
ncbi:MAG: hypothetical protein SGPRY_001153 [Prymnesium sp.]